MTNKKVNLDGLTFLLVDYTGKTSNLLEDLRKVEKFVQYIENQEIKKSVEM